MTSSKTARAVTETFVKNSAYLEDKPLYQEVLKVLLEKEKIKIEKNICHYKKGEGEKELMPLGKEVQEVVDEIKALASFLKEKLDILDINDKHLIKNNLEERLKSLIYSYMVLSEEKRESQKKDMLASLFLMKEKLEEIKEKVETGKDLEFLRQREIIKKQWK